MKKEEVAAQVRQKVIDQVGFPPDMVTEEKDLEKDLIFDTLDLCEFEMNLEETFDITIPEDESNAMHTVGDWTRLVEGKLEILGRIG